MSDSEPRDGDIPPKDEEPHMVQMSCDMFERIVTTLGGVVHWNGRADDGFWSFMVTTE